MTITRDQLEQMKRDVATAERQFEAAKATRQRAVIGELADINKEIKALVRKAEGIADSVDLKFYFNTGYEEFVWSDVDTWDSSSASC